MQWVSSFLVFVCLFTNAVIALDQTVAKVMDCKKFNEGLKQLNARLSEQERVLREAYEKEKQLQDELAGLKTRLEELQKQKTAIDKGSNCVFVCVS